MEIKDIIRGGAEQLANVAEKLQDKEYRDKVLEKVADVIADTAKNAADLTADTVNKTRDYIAENRLAPGAKEEYIGQLEQMLDDKEREIERLNRIIKKRRWQGK